MESNDRRGGAREGWDGAPGCIEVEALFVPYLDGEATPEEAGAVEAHAAACPRCARSLELYRQVGELLHAGPGIAAPPAGLASRARFEACRRGLVQRRLWIGLAAAALLLAGGLALLEPWAGGGGDAPPAEELLGSLDVLEAFQEEGLEPTADLVRLILEEPAEDVEPRSDGALDPSVFKYLLEEELLEDNL
jgi:hypothetical protein